MNIASMIYFAYYNVINISIFYITKMAAEALLKYYREFLRPIFQSGAKISSDIPVASYERYVEYPPAMALRKRLTACCV